MAMELDEGSGVLCDIEACSEAKKTGMKEGDRTISI